MRRAQWGEGETCKWGAEGGGRRGREGADRGAGTSSSVSAERRSRFRSTCFSMLTSTLRRASSPAALAISSSERSPSFSARAISSCASIDSPADCALRRASSSLSLSSSCSTFIAAIRRCSSAGWAAVVSAIRPYWWIVFRMFWCWNLSGSVCSLVLCRTRDFSRAGEPAFMWATERQRRLVQGGGRGRTVWKKTGKKTMRLLLNVEPVVIRSQAGGEIHVIRWEGVSEWILGALLSRASGPPHLAHGEGDGSASGRSVVL